MTTRQLDLALAADQRRLADSNCWMSPLAPLRGKGPSAYTAEPGPLDTPCWLWQGSLNSKGYPLRGTRDGGVYLVHRRVDELRYGPLPPRWHVHHRCETKRCVNPEHLERLTALEHGRHHHATGEAIGAAAVRLLADRGPSTARELAAVAGCKIGSMAVSLARAVGRGEAVKVSRGVYELAHCWRCGGEGSVTVPAYTAGRRDPENDWDGLCDVCRGTGAVCL